MSVRYIHGQTDEREVARLEKQADLTAGFAFPRFDVATGMRVLDLAVGTGAMAARLMRAFPGAAVVGLDLSAAQLNACRRVHPSVPVVRGNGTRMPFADGTFDRVHCTWMLEHVSSPVSILREVRRVLRPRTGMCQFVEVDNWSLGIRPLLLEVHALLAKLNAAQVAGGGDPAIGPRLHHSFLASGFRRFTLEPVLLCGSRKNPEFLAQFIDEFAEIFEGLDESLGPAEQPLITRASQQLRGLLNEPDPEIRYTAYVAHGFS